MTTAEIRAMFLEFFKTKDHAIIPSAPVVPRDDPTVLFTTAGMQPLVPYLMGEEHPQGHRLANSQKCVRTNDIEEVGDNQHLTFFEMLGNWSLGDYFKTESIAWSFEFLTSKKWLGIDPQKLFITVYTGDEHVAMDAESVELWQAQFKAVGLEARLGGRIKAMGRDDNWWQLGDTGPAGPDTEIFYYLGEGNAPEFDPDDGENFVEIWNNVFMTYRGEGDGHYVELDQQNVDTGMGLERIAAVLQGVDTVFDTDVFREIIAAIRSLPTQDGIDEANRKIAERVIADHLRTAVFIAADGVSPSNTAQGYVLRRLIRRAVRHGLALGVNGSVCESVVMKIIECYQGHFEELVENRDLISELIIKEEKSFRQTLRKGLKEFKKLTDGTLDGRMAFTLYDTYGFPLELSIEEAERSGIPVATDLEEQFHLALEEQRERSRTASRGQFKGGLAGDEAIHKKYHTATHLMYRALREVLGDHVVQKGSNINDERTRFDFTHPEKVTPEQQKEIEDWVNEKIAKNLKVSWQEMPTEAALKAGAYGAFGDKYGESVKVYSMKDDDDNIYSFEICGGPHVERTGELGMFKIIKEESSSAGVRRIKAVLQ